jgi:hypothetical protein
MKTNWSAFAALVFTPIFLASTAAQSSDNYAYSGYFSIHQPSENPKMMQVKCALTFFRQDKDGVGRGYVLDRDEFKRSGHVVYLLAYVSHCTFDPKTRTDECFGSSYLAEGDYNSAYYDYIMPEQQKGLDYIGFSTKDDMLSFLKSAEKDPATAVKQSPARNYLHRCVGFSDGRMNWKLSDQQFRKPFEEWQATIVGPTKPSDLLLALEVMKKISAEAYGATEKTP